MRTAVTVTLGLLGACVSAGRASADWEYTHWGMTPEQVAAASHGAVEVIPPAKRERTDVVKLENGAEGTYSDGPFKMHVGFNFSTEGKGLVMVVYSVTDAAQNALFKEWLIKKYGPPQKTGGFEAAGLETVNWKTPDKDEIELDISKGQPGMAVHSPPEGK